jgi:hypothetical protein
MNYVEFSTHWVMKKAKAGKHQGQEWRLLIKAPSILSVYIGSAEKVLKLYFIFD